MKLIELIKYAEYDMPVVEFYNEFGELEYCCNLNEFMFDDIDVAYGKWFEPYGIIKLKRDYGQANTNGKSIQPPESKL
jgi:hypothetical protein|tara:strand:+ start:1198 stop:1431 length:234 start_codon:yes stop_codon:yes gene_type:complete